ncbi:1-acyl-sn-glycerol-3-phosphate acyltransferase [Longimicrobium terrae]|uniref:1-acyl-sn-glycerol-3-phosphate acyltransferase n=1 Tax=Longimicrobium terrae TaxID=1639882 RepID=A0A841GR01_9BACT|nr:1-acyl-sn-glycerol-3-phosphate acyltransferase [Longimicrobium terrae]MBB6069500.1 1-acyl-sn-glycerol-3-phosphate acyltransferase [Longimicrobium terrae]NNC31697.1 acyltransferase [Longimicrobium terrae]
MWLLPVLSHVSRFVVRAFYRLEVDGDAVPAHGPVLLVANHPNSLVDPAMVGAVAGRPVRFLAKAPLFSDGQVGWLVRGSGSIPVYRRADNPSEVGRNEDTFRAVHQALADGSAVGIFPEGISHSEPSMAPLKTGAARIALGGAALLGAPFPIIPVGLTFRSKEQFRSEALAVVGQPVRWDDLAARGEGDHGAARELTARIDAELRRVTLNLERWEDQPMVETAEAVYAAELGADPSSAARVQRLSATTEALARLRREEHAAWEDIAAAVQAHAGMLGVVRMTPAELKSAPDAREAARWVARQANVLRLLSPAALAGMVIFFVPYRLTGFVEKRARPSDDIRATYKTLVGGVLHLIWIAMLAGAAGWMCGWTAGVAALVVLPLLAWATLWSAESWNHASGEARRFLLRARRAEAIDELRQRQHDLAVQLAALWERVRI